MAAGANASEQAGGKVRVRPQEIEGALDRIRQSAAADDAKQEAAAKGSAGPRQRATLSNLVILTSARNGHSAQTAIDSLLSALCVIHPSRFFIVEYDPAASADRVNEFGIGTAVSSRCVLAESGAHVCSEEVYISVAEKGVPLIANLLLSLFVSGVEIVLLVLDDPLAHGEGTEAKGYRELFTALRGLSRTVIYDSAPFFSLIGASTPRGKRAAAELRAEMQTAPTSSSGPRLCDMNFYRIARWRELIADGFDVERMQASIDGVTEVTVAFARAAGAAGLPGTTVLLGGWIASCLGWTAERMSVSGKTTKFQCRGRSRSATLTFLEVSSGGDASDPIVSVEFAFDPAVYQGGMRLARLAEQESLELTVQGCSTQHDSSCDFYVRRMPWKPQPLEQLVLRGVIAQRTDHHCEEAQRAATTLAECAAA